MWMSGRWFCTCLASLWLVSSAQCHGARTGEEAGYHVPSVTYLDLVKDETQPDIKRWLAWDGMFQVSSIPGFASSKERVLKLAGECILAAQEQKQFNLPDGTLRKTFAAATQLGKSYEMALGTLFADGAPDACKAFEQESLGFRRLVTQVSNLVFHQLDNVCGSASFNRHNRIARSVTPFSADYETAWQFLNAGEHLEHFHGYQASCSATTRLSRETLDIHVDDGLFIAFVPALWVSMSSKQVQPLQSNLGFYVETPNGALKQPVFVDDGNVLVFMLGEAAADWFSHCPPMRKVPHSLRLQDVCDSEDGAELLRLWYGRMMMPPHDALHEAQNKTFGEIRKEKMQAILAQQSHSSSASPVSLGCSDGRVLADAAQSCPEGEFYCWMDCRPWNPETSGCTNSTPIDEFQCKSPSGEVWVPGDDHCPTCVTTCEPTPSVDTSAICNGYATTMYMLGFTGTDSYEGCVVLLFRPWVLDTPAKYAIGTIGTFLFGIIVELVIFARRKNGKRTTKLAKPLEVSMYLFLYAIQVTFGYFAMLLAMTYSVWIFLAVVLGLTTGHALFNMQLKGKVSAQGDPCCQFMEEVNVEEDDTSPNKSVNISGTRSAGSHSAASTASDDDKITDANSCCTGHQEP